MATIHRTTMAPTKQELIGNWLPRQPWYRDTGAPPQLTRGGGFRLDDPAGQVGLEFIVVIDGVHGTETTYFVPLAYRGAPLPEAEEGLLGTSEHGVLGTRWIYDAAHDPVAVTALVALLCGTAEAQHQDESDTPDRSVGRSWVGGARLTVPTPLEVADTGRGTTAVGVELTDDTADGGAELTLDIVRTPVPDPYTGLGHVETDWRRLDGTTGRGVVAVVW